MAMLKSLNKIGSAPPAPDPLPDTALILVEINGQVYKAPVSAIVDLVPEPDPE